MGFVPVLLAVTTAFGVAGSYAQGKAEEAAEKAQGDADLRQAEAEKANLEYNARVKEAEARAEEQSGMYEARRKAREARAYRSQMKVGFAASGGSLLSPSAMAVLSEQAAFDEMDRQAILYNSATRARQLRAGAAMDIRSGELALQRGKTSKELAYMRGKSAKRAGTYAAGTSLLTGSMRTYQATTKKTKKKG